MTPDEQTVERVAKAIWCVSFPDYDFAGSDTDIGKISINMASAAIAAMPETTQARNDALREAAKVSAEDRENIVDEIESIICETHEMDVRDIDYAENIVSWLERHHPAALRAISGMPDTTQQSSGADGNREPIMWAVEKWRDEVQNRPLHNVLRRTLDDTWRTVMRKFGGDPEELVGPAHDDLVATDAEPTT